MIPLLLALSAASGPRCGPSRCGDGEVCCNDSCGSCVPADRDDVGCVALHCGWDEYGPGMSRPMVAPGAWHPQPLIEVDLQLGYGQGDPAAALMALGSVRAPLGRMWFVDGHLSRVGVTGEGAGRSMLLRVAAGWNVPTGWRKAHAAVLAGFEGRQDAAVEATRPSDAFNARRVGEPWTPAVVVGGALSVGRGPWAATGSARATVGAGQLDDPALEVGVEGHGDVSMDLAQYALPVAVRFGTDVRLAPGGALAGGGSASVMLSTLGSRLQLGFDGRMGTHVDPAGEVVPLLTGGLRLRTRYSGRDLRALIESLPSGAAR